MDHQSEINAQDTQSFPFKKVAIIGGGLLGASLCCAIKKHVPNCHISIYDNSQTAQKQLEKLSIADEVSNNILDCVKEAECVILCTPVGVMGSCAQQIIPHMKQGALLTDVGSVKTSIIEAITPHLKNHIHFIPAHPVAGTENSGPNAGFAELFEKRWSIITPLPKTDNLALNALKAFWRIIGANVEIMTPKHHDLVLAITSHLPHLIAYNIVGTASDLETVTESEVIKFSAGGFRDFTRIAASDPVMWRDIFLNNKEAVLETLGRFSEDLAMLQRAIRWDDGDHLMKLFTHTRDIRRSIIDSGQDTAEADFGRIAKSE